MIPLGQQLFVSAIQIERQRQPRWELTKILKPGKLNCHFLEWIIGFRYEKLNLLSCSK